MKRLLLALLLFSIPVLAETNDLDKTFLDIALGALGRRFESCRPDQL